MNLDELKKLCYEATPGPWKPWWVATAPQETSSGEMRQLVHGAAPPHEIIEPGGEDAVKKAMDDAAFISAAREAMPKLIAEVERLTLEASFWQERYNPDSERTMKRLSAVAVAARYFACQVYEDERLQAPCTCDDGGECLFCQSKRAELRTKLDALESE